MAANTKIEWTGENGATWNPITGCSIVSPGCTHCYAMALAGTRMKHHPSREGLTQPSKAGPVWTGEVRFNEQWLDQPLRWKTPRMIFVVAHGDLFGEAVPDEWIDRIFAVMALAPQHTFQVLTKRPERMRAYLRSIFEGDGEAFARFALTEVPHPAGTRSLVDLMDVDGFIKPLRNVWLGVSVEDQTRADERIPILLDTPAAIRWISAEPLLGELNLQCLRKFNSSSKPWINALTGVVTRGGLPRSPSECGFDVSSRIPGKLPRLDWVVAGGESLPPGLKGPARPMHPEWARSLRDQCAAAGVPFFFKQWGDWISAKGMPRDLPIGHVFDDGYQMIRVGKKAAGRLLDGVIHDGFPVAEEVRF